MNETTINRLKEYGIARLGAADAVSIYEIASDPDVSGCLRRIIELVAEDALPDDWENALYATIKIALERRYPEIMGVVTKRNPEEEATN